MAGVMGSGVYGGVDCNGCDDQSEDSNQRVRQVAIPPRGAAAVECRNIKPGAVPGVDDVVFACHFLWVGGWLIVGGRHNAGVGAAAVLVGGVGYDPDFFLPDLVDRKNPAAVEQGEIIKLPV